MAAAEPPAVAPARGAQAKVTAHSLASLRRELSTKPYQVGFDTIDLNHGASMLSILGREAPWKSVLEAIAALGAATQCRGAEIEHALPTDNEECAKERAIELLSGILCVAQLQYLSLRWLPCPPKAWEAFSSCRPSLSIQVLELERCKLKGADLQHVCTFITRQPNLESLSLAHNPIGVDGALAVLGALQSSGARLAELSLAACSLSKFKDSDAAQWMAQIVGGDGADAPPLFADLLELNLSSNRLQAAGVAAFQTLIRQATHLQSLNLRSNAIGLAGVDALGGILSSLGALQQLDIGGNQLPAAACTALAEALPSELHSLDISNNPLTSHGLLALLCGSWVGGSLWKLDLSRCKLCYIGMEALSTALEGCTSLTHLNLADNKIQDTGCGTIGKQLESVGSLELLDLTACSLSDSSEGTLSNLCTACNKLIKLRLAANKLSASVEQRIQLLIQER